MQDLLLAGQLDMGHARALLALEAPAQVELADRIVARTLSVRQAEAMVRRAISLAGDAGPVAPRAADRDLLRLEEELSDALAARVQVRASARGRGQVLIDFASLEELQGILDRLRRQ